MRRPSVPSQADGYLVTFWCDAPRHARRQSPSMCVCLQQLTNVPIESEWAGRENESNSHKAVPGMKALCVCVWVK